MYCHDPRLEPTDDELELDEYDNPFLDSYVHELIERRKGIWED